MHAHKFLLVVSMTAVMVVSANLRADDTPEEAALREALRKAGSTSATQPMTPPVAKPAPAMNPAPTPAPKPVPVQPRMSQPVAAPGGQSGGATASGADHDALIEALRTQQGTTASAPTATEVSIPPPSMSPALSQGTTAFEPLQAPALPISATKQQRLDALLSQYKADQITPEQYHTQRAAILAEP